jgi:hypothetical protein
MLQILSLIMVLRWTDITDVNTASRALPGSGTQTAAVVAGETSWYTVYTGVESWNGSAWTEVTDLNTARAFCKFSTGTQTAALCGGLIQVHQISKYRILEWNKLDRSK